MGEYRTASIEAENVPDQVDVVVIGAGFAGLYAHYRFRQIGLSVFGLEQADDVGGTWQWNRYPGARCDVESLDYCYSFSPELLAEWEWSERFATQEEILRYIQYVADKFDLKRDIAFSRKVVSASFDESANRWAVETDQGEWINCQYLVTTVGCLSLPKKRDFEGLEEFQGRWVETGAWPRDGVEWSGKRVAVIGTGSSGIQSIPIIAKDAASLTVFQRTANYSVPAHNGPIKPQRRAQVRQNYQAYLKGLYDTRGGLDLPLNIDKSTLEFSDEERRAKYEDAWADGRFHMQTLFNDVMTDAEANRLAAEFVNERIREQVDDPAVAEKLIPRGYPLGAKRLCLDTDYYATFNRDNVQLVDINDTPIERITRNGIKTSDREFDLDLIVFATGFDAITGPLLSLGITGQGGVKLKDAWKDGPSSYLGIASPGFPNLFTVTGPFSPSVLTNVIRAIEHHVDLVAECIGYMRDKGLDRMEADPEATEAWVEETREISEYTLFPKANSWYIGANVPGKPRRFMVYAGGLDNYVARCAQVVANGWTGFRLNACHTSSPIESAAS